MVQIFNTYSTDKQRTTPILSVDGKGMGFLSSRDAIAISCPDSLRSDCGIRVDSATFSDGSTIQRHFEMVSWKKELFKVSWDGKPTDPTICVTTSANFNELLTKYSRDSRWTRV